MRKVTKWKYRKYGTDQFSADVEEYAQQIGVISPVATMLLNRELNVLDKAKAFFNPGFEQLWDPFLIQDMEKAIDKVQTVIESGKPILVFGDYDVDGTTGAALLTWFFRDNGVPVEYYIPDRETEGYGLSTQGIDRADAIGAGLVTTCDCAINAFAEIDYANEKGIPVIITDHHRPAERLPDAYTALNPKRNDCDYPFEGLCGCGVAFKFAQAMCRVFTDRQVQGKNTERTTSADPWDENRLFTHLDLVAIATSADMVPVTGENRVLISEGLRQILDSNKPGVRALLSVSGFDSAMKNRDALNVGNVVFQVAPRINAVGRMGSASRAVELLTTTSPKRAKYLANVLDEENQERRKIERETVDAAIYQLQSKYYNIPRDGHRAIVLWDEGWHQGVIGIVASKLKEKFHLPIVVIAVNDGLGKGSARSITGFDLYDAFSECASHFIGFGGHAMAAGLSIAPDSLEAFEEQFQEIAARDIDEEMLVPHLTLETDLRFTDIGAQLMQALERLGPYGPGNMRPLFGAREVQVTGLPRIVGENHLKFKAKQGRTVLDAIGFNMGEYYELLIKNEPVDLAFVVEKNEWNGRVTTQLNIRDIVLTQDNPSDAG